MIALRLRAFVHFRRYQTLDTDKTLREPMFGITANLENSTVLVEFNL